MQIFYKSAFIFYNLLKIKMFYFLLFIKTADGDLLLSPSALVLADQQLIALSMHIDNFYFTIFLQIFA